MSSIIVGKRCMKSKWYEVAAVVSEDARDIGNCGKLAFFMFVDVRV